MKKRFFHDHPMLGGVIAMLLAFAACYIISMPVAKLVPLFNPDSEELRTTASLAGRALTAGCAIVCLFGFQWLNRKNGYHGL